MQDRKVAMGNKDSTSYYPLFFTIVFLIILFQYSFAGVEAIFYDLRTRLDIGARDQQNIVFVTMDEESEEFLGETYPYTYIGHKRLLERLLLDRPAALVYVVGFLQPESLVERENMEAFRRLARGYIQEGGIFRIATSMDSWGEYLPPEELRDLGYSLGIINVDNMAFAKDDVARRAIINVSGEDSVHLWVANRFREKQGRDALTVNDINGAYYLRDADATFTLFRYPFSTVEGNQSLSVIPFHRAQVGNFPDGFFEDKIVVIGSSYISNAQDFVLTPFNTERYESLRLFVHGAIIDAFVQNKTVSPLPMELSFSFSVIIAIILSFAISRLRPTRGLVVTISILLLVLFVAYLLFVWFGYWLYVSHLILTVFLVYYIWVPFRAIGEYQRRYAIQEETKLLKKVENLKQNFISLMSHDLKTPVAKIAGIADVMKQKYKDNLEVKKDLEMVGDATRELNGFITSILDLTKIESQDLTLNKVSKDINKVIENVIDTYKFESAKNKIQIQQELAPLYPIKMDLNLIKRVISNLVENAIKYSGQGTRIIIRSWDDEKWVYIEVEDNGPGIAEADLEHIFDRFYRVKNDVSHKVKGTGLGLYLVKYFVELHGGEISVSSQLGQGTKFTVKLLNE